MAIIYDTDQPAHYGNHYDSPGSYNPRFNGSFALLVIVILLLMLFWGDLPWLRRNLNTVSRPAVQGSITRPLTNIRYVTADNLDLRDEPSQAARASYILPRGTKVVLLGKSQRELDGDVWLKVRIETLEGSQVGWVSQQYVE